MPFRPCPSGCGRFLSADDRHDRCLQCLGRRHAEVAFVDDSCVCCGRMSMISLQSRLSFMKGLAPSADTRADLSGSSRGSPADALGDLRVTVRASPPCTPPRTSYSSRSEHPVRFPGDFAGLSHGAPSISFGAPSVDRMSITASGDGFTSSEDEGAVGLPPSGVVATAAPNPELTAMLARAAVSIGLEVNRPPSPEPSRLDNWFLGAGRGSQPRPAPVPFFPEVHEELTSSWMAHQFGEDASERTAFCAIHPYSLSLHHHSYVDCAVGAAYTASGGVAHAASLSRWLTRTIRLGYAIQFARRPTKFNGVLETSVAVRNAPVLREEIAILLAKDAIEPVPPAEMRQGFYSPYSIVPKKGGGLRPILDLRVLHRALHKLPFKMLTHRRMIKCIQPQDWFAAIDLKDAYFHV